MKDNEIHSKQTNYMFYKNHTLIVISLNFLYPFLKVLYNLQDIALNGFLEIREFFKLLRVYILENNKISKLNLSLQNKVLRFECVVNHYTKLFCVRMKKMGKKSHINHNF